MKLGVYDYIASISDINKLGFLFIISIVLFVFTTLAPITIAQIGGLLVGISVIIILQDREFSNIDTFNREMEFKLNTIKRLVRSAKKDRPGPMKRKDVINDPQFLHHDADIINLLYNVKDFYQYNPASFQLTVKSIDNVLRLHDELRLINEAIGNSENPAGEIRRGAGRCEDNLDVLDENQSDALNHFHSLIISMPSNLVLDNKHTDNQKRLHLLLQRHRDDAFRLCKKLQKFTGYHKDRKVIANIGPKATTIHDTFANSQFQFY